MKKGRNKSLISQRNQLLIVRYWYWTEIWQRRHDMVLRVLEDEEFFIRERSIESVIRSDETIYKRLCKERPSIKDLRTKYPGFNWEENKHFSKPISGDQQMNLFAS